MFNFISHPLRWLMRAAAFLTLLGWAFSPGRDGSSQTLSPSVTDTQAEKTGSHRRETEAVKSCETRFTIPSQWTSVYSTLLPTLYNMGGEVHTPPPRREVLIQMNRNVNSIYPSDGLCDFSLVPDALQRVSVCITAIGMYYFYNLKPY